MFFSRYRDFYTFQNSRKGSIQLKYTGNGCNVTFVPVFQPISPKDITKGTKVYNYDAAKSFTITHDEIIVLKKFIDYYHEQQELPDYGKDSLYGTAVTCTNNALHVTHWPQDGQSVLSVIPATDENSQGSWILSYNFYRNKAQEFQLAFRLDPVQFKIFYEFLENFVIFKASYLAAGSIIFEYSKEENNSQSAPNTSSTSYGNQNAPQNQMNAQQTDTTTQQAQAAPQKPVSNPLKNFM